MSTSGPTPQEIVNACLWGDHIVKAVCRRTGLRLLDGGIIQKAIMSAGESFLKFPEAGSSTPSKPVGQPKNGRQKVDAEAILEVLESIPDEEDPEQRKVGLTIGELAKHGAAYGTLCRELLQHRRLLMHSSAEVIPPKVRARALVDEMFRLKDEYGEENFIKGALNNLGDKGNWQKVDLEPLMVNVLSKSFPDATLDALKKRIQRAKHES